MFQAKQFAKANLVHHTEVVKVPGLAKWFDGEPEWTVRGLTGHELSLALEAQERRRKLSDALLAIAGDTPESERVTAIREALGIGTENLSADVVKRLEMLVHGSVEPKVDMDVARKLFTNYPIEFYQLTMAIMRLTGLGAGLDEGKSPPSGPIPASEGR
jgi:hypothetical protein